MVRCASYTPRGVAGRPLGLSHARLGILGTCSTVNWDDKPLVRSFRYTGATSELREEA